MGYEPDAAEEEDRDDDIGYTRGLGKLEVAAEGEVPVDRVGG